MAEQISHKKSLRVSSLNKDRRLLLREFYNLENEPDKDGKDARTGEKVSKAHSEEGQVTSVNVDTEGNTEKPVKKDELSAAEEDPKDCLLYTSRCV